MTDTNLSSAFRLHIACDNAAFEGDNLNHEIARCLRDVAKRIEDGADFNDLRNIHDINGNVVGQFALTRRPTARTDS